jgi:hypothetical protein
MSCYEWTHGEVKLPANEVSKVWKTLVAAVTADSQRKYDAAQAFWKGLTRKEQTDAEAYKKALYRREDFGYDLPSVDWTTNKPRRAKKTDYQWPTSTSTVLHADGLTITLNRKTRTIRYDVGENNHAREHADATALGKAWHKAMADVRWTRGTGGVLRGNDEYQREAGEYSVGGGGSYVVEAYGYLGAAEAPGNVGEFQTPTGWMHVESIYSTRTGTVKGKVKAGRKPRKVTSYGSSGYWR